MSAELFRGRTQVPAAVAGLSALALCSGLATATVASATPAAKPLASVRLSGPAAALVHHATRFSVSTKLKAGDKIKSYVVKFGDRTKHTRKSGRPPASVHHTFARSGVFTVTVTLRDVHGRSATSSTQLTVDPATGTFDYYNYSARIPRSYQAGPFIDERGKPNAGDQVTPLTKRGTYSGCPGFIGPEKTPDGGVKPDIFINRGKKFTDGAGVTIPAHSIFAHPGVAAKYSPTVRFANPAGRSVRYTATATITSLDGGGGDGVAGFLYQTSGGKIVKKAANDGAVSSAPPTGSTPSQSFTLTGRLPAHGSIYVVVGNNGTYNYDTAGIQFKVSLG